MATRKIKNLNVYNFQAIANQNQIKFIKNLKDKYQIKALENKAILHKRNIATKLI